MFDGKAFGKEVVDIVKGYVSKAVEPLVDRIEALENRQPDRGEKGDPGEPGRDGADGADGKDGRDGVDGKDGEPGMKGDPGVDGKDGRDGADGKDGAGLADALIDQKGALVLTMTDGRTKELGRVAGRDGLDGEKGETGADGKDGLGFDDLEVVHDGERGFTFRFARGEQVKEFPFTLPVVLDRGVYRDGESYEKGDAVTWAGSVWIAQEDTAEKPDSGKGWRLSVKRGRDGKDAAK